MSPTESQPRPGTLRAAAHRLLPWWRLWEWPVVWSVGVAALLLGYAGFWEFFARTDPSRSAWDVLYLSIQLFTMDSGNVVGPLPAALQVARFLAPLVTVYTASKALMLLFRNQLDRLRVRGASGHAVVCGLGRKGLLLADAFVRRGGPLVVVIEANESNPWIPLCRERGMKVVIGDAASPGMLESVGVQRARYLVAVAASDGDNAEIAARGRRLARRPSDVPLTCLMHIADRALYERLRLVEHGTARSAAPRLEVFNMFERAGRALVTAWPPGPGPCVVLGLNQLGEAIVLATAHRWQVMRADADARLRVHVVDDRADEQCARLRARFPELDDTTDLIPHALALDSLQVERHGGLETVGELPTCVYVCHDDEARALAAGFAASAHLRDAAVPVVVQLSAESGLAALCGGPESCAAGVAGVIGFPLHEHTCTVELLFDELLARAIHANYVRQREAEGETVALNPSMVPWDRLPEHLRESNRRQADHVGVKLDAIGCTLAPRADWSAPLLAFTDEEVERLAQMEHERFVVERQAAGWRLTPGQKDVARRLSPYLVAWDALPEHIREYDREAVRAIPLLARAGEMDVVRRG